MARMAVLGKVLFRSPETLRYGRGPNRRLGGRTRASMQADPQWLFFRGHFALSENNILLARESWSKLLAGLPPDSELANLLTEKLASLP